MSTFTGDRIKKYRIEKKLTQKKLGELCGIADSNIRKYEAGNQNPKIETLQKIADALEIPVSYLYMGKLIDPKELDLESNNRLTRITSLKRKLLAQYKKALDSVLTEIEYLNVEAIDLQERIDTLSKELQESNDSPQDPD